MGGGRADPRAHRAERGRERLSRYSADDKKAAWTVVSAVLGFWVGVGAA